MDTTAAAASPVRPDFTRVLDKSGEPIGFPRWFSENLTELSEYYKACDPDEYGTFMLFAELQYDLQDSIDQEDPYTKDDYDADEADSKYDGRGL